MSPQWQKDIADTSQMEKTTDSTALRHDVPKIHRRLPKYDERTAEKVPWIRIVF